MSGVRRIGRGVAIVLGSILLVLGGIVITVLVLGVTAAGVCFVTSDPVCNDDPTYSAIEITPEQGSEGVAVVMTGQRNPLLSDAYIDAVGRGGSEGATLASHDAATDTFRFVVDPAPEPGAWVPLTLRLHFGGRTGTKGCAERGQGMYYSTIVQLRLHRGQDGSLHVTDVEDSILHHPGHL